MNLIENTGELPNQLEVILTVLLAKPQGGFRPIAILPAVCRSWMKIRRPTASRGSEMGTGPFFAMAEGQAPGDSVWRSAIKKEAAVGDGKEAVALLWDMEKAYEVIEVQSLIKEAGSLKCPSHVQL